MQRFILRRILWNIPVLLLISVVTFGAMHLVPGGPFSTRDRPIHPQIQDLLEEKYDLNKPVWQQYINYMGRLLLHGDLGPSYRNPDRSVNDMIFGSNYLVNVLRERLQVSFGTEASSMTFEESPSLFDSQATIIRTSGEVLGSMDITWNDRFQAVQNFLKVAPIMVSAQVGFVSVSLALLIGVPLGIISALRQNTWVDYSAMLVSMMGVSVPNFLLGIILILVFALYLEWLPTYGWGESWTQIILPAITLGTGGMAFIARLTRASMLEVIRADYIRTARAKGLTERIVIMRHALKNSLIPLTTVLGPLMAAWLTGAFLVEHVFSIGGIGRFFVTGVTNRDYMLIMGTILIYSVALVVFNLLVDVAYGVIDPRIRLQ